MDKTTHKYHNKGRVMDYFYAAQLRQYRLQFIRAFSNFQVNVGTEATPELKRVPCRYGDPSRIAQTILQGNSENKMPTTPFISCTVSGLSMAANRRQDPTLVEKIQVNEREYDEETGRYTQDLGNRYTVERIMPVPYDLTMQVDIWTPNLSIKEQLVEQIMMLYNPSVDFQTSNNPLDWTFLSYIEMQESITWSSRSIPIGTDNPIDVMTMTFKVPIWINPPAKVKRQAIIEQIVTDIIQGYKGQYDWEWSEYEFMSRVITTPGDHSIRLEYAGDTSYEIRLLSESGNADDSLNRATVTATRRDTVLIPGSAFSFNGIRIEVNTTDLSTFVDQSRILLKGTPYSIQLYNKNALKFINDLAGDNIFSDIVGSPLNSMGLAATTYPGGDYAWWRLFEAYGVLKSYADFGNNASQLRIKKNPDLDDDSDDIVGWIDPHPTDQNRIIWRTDPQTLPGMTLSPINAIIDPQEKGPNVGLPAPTIGTRYLLTKRISDDSYAWGIANADEDDIIEWSGSGWFLAFDASENTGTQQRLVNLYTGKIYAWAADHWSLYIDQLYTPGHWRIAL
jgi:hypothetical protein